MLIGCTDPHMNGSFESETLQGHLKDIDVAVDVSDLRSGEAVLSSSQRQTRSQPCYSLAWLPVRTCGFASPALLLSRQHAIDWFSFILGVCCELTLLQTPDPALNQSLLVAAV